VCGGDRQKERDMSIRMNLDVEMAKRKMSLTDLAGRVGITIGQYVSAQDREGKGRKTVDT
jgi:DNA-binding Xre family transcriptional regulator